MAPHRTVEPAATRFVTAGDVRKVKNRLNPTVSYLDAAFPICPAIPAEIKAAWRQFSDGWRTFYDEQETLWSNFHAASMYATAMAYEEDIKQWVTAYSKYQCPLPAPIMPSDTRKPSEGFEFIGPQTQTVLKIVAVSGAVAFVALGVREMMR